MNTVPAIKSLVSNSFTITLQFDYDHIMTTYMYVVFYGTKILHVYNMHVSTAH